jgi:subtilase family serine protease
MNVTLLLRPRHKAQLNAFVAKPHKALRPAQFKARYSPTTTVVRGIRSWARAQKLAVKSVSANRLLVRLRGSSVNFARAFGTHFARFHSTKTGSFFQITRTARVPKAFAGRVGAVLGLSSLSRVSRPQVPHPTAAAQTKLGGIISGLLNAHNGALPGLGALPSSPDYPNQYGPKDFWSMYNAPSSQTGSGQQLAIITEGNVSQPKADLATFENKFGLPTVTWNQVTVGAASTDTSGDDEWDLDSQYSTGFAPGVTQLDVYVGSSMSDQDITSTINRWVTDDLSKQGSFSAGECELLAYASGFTSSLDTILEQGDAQGQSMFFSSGDTGAFCPAVVGVNGVPAGVPGDSYPASSPYGLGVGGTSVLSPSGPSEIAWYAGGGGPSDLEPVPAYQSTTSVGGVALLTRGVPDVALDADPESGYEVIVSGTEEVIGGTSASAPSWQGIWARAQGAHGGALGFAGPVIYDTEPASAFNDITLGTNGFPAAPGWDYTTGRGTPNITAFVNGS